MARFVNGETRSSVLEGFTIQNGRAPAVAGGNGGGVFVLLSSPAIRGNVIRWNTASQFGGALFVEGGSSLIEGNRIEGNAAYRGGGLFLRAASAAVSENEIRRNTSRTAGGGIAAAGEDSSLVRDNEILENHTDGSGAGMAIFDSSTIVSGNELRSNEAALGGGLHVSRSPGADVTRNRFLENAAVGAGGVNLELSGLRFAANVVARNVAGSGAGVVVKQGDPRLAANTIGGNVASCQGGGIVANHATPTVTNSIIWGNEAALDPSIAVQRAGTVTVSDSIVEGGFVGVNVMDVDPLVVSVAWGEFHLRIDSPALDVADATDPDLPSVDIEGDLRVTGEDPGVDLGADEMRPEIAARFGTVKPRRRRSGGSALPERLGGRRPARGAGSRAVVRGRLGGRAPRGFLARPVRDVRVDRRAGPHDHPPAAAGARLDVVSDPARRRRGQPVVIWNNLGFPGRIGAATQPSLPAPSMLFAAPNGPGQTMTLQGFVEDEGSAAEVPVSITNAVVLRVMLAERGSGRIPIDETTRRLGGTRWIRGASGGIASSLRWRATGGPTTVTYLAPAVRIRRRFHAPTTGRAEKNAARGGTRMSVAVPSKSVPSKAVASPAASSRGSSSRRVRSFRSLDRLLDEIERGEKERPEWLRLEGECRFDRLPESDRARWLARLYGCVRRGFRVPNGLPKRRAERLALWRGIARAGFHDFGSLGWTKPYDCPFAQDYDYVADYLEGGIDGLDPYRIYTVVLGTFDFNVDDMVRTELLSGVEAIVEPMAGSAEFAWLSHFERPGFRYFLLDLDPNAREYALGRPWLDRTEVRYEIADVRSEAAWRRAGRFARGSALAYLGKQSQGYFDAQTLSALIDTATRHVDFLMMDIPTLTEMSAEPEVDERTRPEMEDAGFRVALVDDAANPPNPLTGRVDFRLEAWDARARRTLFEYRDWTFWHPMSLVTLGRLLDLEMYYFHGALEEFVPVESHVQTAELEESESFLVFTRDRAKRPSGQRSSSAR